MLLQFSAVPALVKGSWFSLLLLYSPPAAPMSARANRQELRVVHCRGGFQPMAPRPPGENPDGWPSSQGYGRGGRGARRRWQVSDPRSPLSWLHGEALWLAGTRPPWPPTRVCAGGLCLGGNHGNVRASSGGGEVKGGSQSCLKENVEPAKIIGYLWGPTET